AGRRGRLARLHQHERNRGVRVREQRLADRELRAEVEGLRRAGGHRRSVRGRRTLTEIDEDERAASLMNDARVLGRDPRPAQSDVAMRGASDDDGLLTESRYHSHRLYQTGRRDGT